MYHIGVGGDDVGLDGFTDEELAAAAAAGDPEAFEVLVTRMAPIVLRFVRRMVGDAQTGEDLAQETVLALWRGLPEFAFRSTVRTWVLGIAHRKVVDHYRRRRDVPAPDTRFADLEAPEPLPAEAAEQTALRDALRTELSQMQATPRAVWWLREVEGLSLAEIATVLSLTDGSVRGHLQRSRAFLTTRLAPWKPGASVHAGEPSAEPRSERGQR
ncbi:RNA polymerase sigma factor [Gordonia hydrophobica]|uniref:Sigma-70 family RNA polymerase sigma factor n=1 Tax=Gordonia hydrophobica TaxID=40516 RepID=A0ABZ2U716_9ACTN|nr:sigma-70 family RNA polymerase sigma factor [Gordonia hydrophobica]MBM7366137.1 RNA polymerase sigma-70 factor (ECF subfamily) [Gordonia hydrophobica]